MMILDLHRQGLSVTAIARRTGRDPKTVRKYIERGLELPVYGPRQVGRPNKLAPYIEYLRERVAAFPELTATRLTRELRERGYTGAYTAVKRFVAAIRPSDGPKPFEVRFETPSGHQAQVDFARFVTRRVVEVHQLPDVIRILDGGRLVATHPILEGRRQYRIDPDHRQGTAARVAAQRRLALLRTADSLVRPECSST